MKALDSENLPSQDAIREAADTLYGLKIAEIIRDPEQRAALEAVEFWLRDLLWEMANADTSPE